MIEGPSVTTTRVGRGFGGLLLLQLAGFIVPFVLLLPLGRDFLTAAAPSAGPIRTAVILLFANGGLTIGLSLIAARMLRGGGDTGPQWLVAAGIIMCLTQAVDNACVLSMLAASERVAAASGPVDALQVAGEAIRIVRQWTHTVAILAIDVWIASLYLLLRRRRVIPDALAMFGLVTVGLHVVGIPLRSLLGYGPLAPLGMPMALGHLALAGWLIVRGWPPADPEGRTAA